MKTTSDKLLVDADIARELDFPEAFLAKVLQNIIPSLIKIIGPHQHPGFLINYTSKIERF